MLKISLSHNPQMGKYTKTSENQDLNDFLLETLTWITPNNKEILFFPKNMLFPRELLYR